MVDSIRDKLRAEVMAAGWNHLIPQFARGALLLAAPELDLLEVAEALARDDAALVQGWLAERALRRAEDADARNFTEASKVAEPRFQFVIVQPWVLAQRL